jgi:hypothetical protein
VVAAVRDPEPLACAVVVPGLAVVAEEAPLNDVALSLGRDLLAEEDGRHHGRTLGSRVWAFSIRSSIQRAAS